MINSNLSGKPGLVQFAVLLSGIHGREMTQMLIVAISCN